MATVQLRMHRLPRRLIRGDAPGIRFCTIRRARLNVPHWGSLKSYLKLIECISSVTLATHNMPRAVRFYCALGFEIVHGDANAAFTSSI